MKIEELLLLVKVAGLVLGVVANNSLYLPIRKAEVSEVLLFGCWRHGDSSFMITYIA